MTKPTFLIVPPLLEGSSLKKHMKEHSVSTKKGGFREVTKPMRVYKQVTHNSKKVIAELIIPTGATVFANSTSYTDTLLSYRNDRKIRASEAYVAAMYSVAEYAPRSYQIQRKHIRTVKTATSVRTSSFNYTTGAVVTPDKKFSKQPYVCESGIHCFVNLHDALNYNFT